MLFRGGPTPRQVFTQIGMEREAAGAHGELPIQAVQVPLHVRAKHPQRLANRSSFSRYGHLDGLHPPGMGEGLPLSRSRRGAKFAHRVRYKRCEGWPLRRRGTRRRRRR